MSVIDSPRVARFAITLMLIDTHAHFDYSDFNDERDALIERARATDVREIITIATDLGSCQRAVDLAKRYPSTVWAAVGIHPNDVPEAPEDYLPQLREFATKPGVVAIGEIGLDYHQLPGQRAARQGNEVTAELVAEDAQLKERQDRIFREQLDLAVELDLPVVVHQRDCWEETLSVLRDYADRVRAVLHCFVGTPAEAEEAIALGHLVSFTGIVTFKNARQVHESATAVPFDKFMVETDCPYLAPHPHRGKRCEPSHTRLVADKIAELRGLDYEAVAAQTTETARRFFRFPQG